MELLYRFLYNIIIIINGNRIIYLLSCKFSCGIEVILYLRKPKNFC